MDLFTSFGCHKYNKAKVHILLALAGLSAASRIAAEIQEMSLRGEPEQPSTPIQTQEAVLPPSPASLGEPTCDHQTTTSLN